MSTGLYEVEEWLGSGSHGAVSRIRRKADQKVLVWKAVHYGSMSEKEKRMIVSEVNILRGLRTPFVVRYHDRIVDKPLSTLYIVMEHCAGGDLGQLIASHRRKGTWMSQSFLWQLAAQLCLGLHSCHTHPQSHHQKSAKSSAKQRGGGELEREPGGPPGGDGGGCRVDEEKGGALKLASSSSRASHPILHRDIKPANVFLDEALNAKLGDFGSSAHGSLAASSSSASPTQAQGSTLFGTPAYHAPELVNGEEGDERSDVWSLGCVLYEAAALSPPFTADNQAALAVMIDAGEFEELLPGDHRGYSSAFCKAVSWMLTKERRKRPTTVHLLQWSLSSRTGPSLPPPSLPPSSSSSSSSSPLPPPSSTPPSSSSSSPPPPSFASALLDARVLVLAAEREAWARRVKAEKDSLRRRAGELEKQAQALSSRAQELELREKALLRAEARLETRREKGGNGDAEGKAAAAQESSLQASSLPPSSSSFKRGKRQSSRGFEYPQQKQQRQQRQERDAGTSSSAAAAAAAAGIGGDGGHAGCESDSGVHSGALSDEDYDYSFSSSPSPSACLSDGSPPSPPPPPLPPRSPPLSSSCHQRALEGVGECAGGAAPEGTRRSREGTRQRSSSPNESSNDTNETFRVDHLGGEKKTFGATSFFKDTKEGPFTIDTTDTDTTFIGGGSATTSSIRTAHRIGVTTTTTARFLPETTSSRDHQGRGSDTGHTYQKEGQGSPMSPLEAHLHKQDSKQYNDGGGGSGGGGRGGGGRGGGGEICTSKKERKGGGCDDDDVRDHRASSHCLAEAKQAPPPHLPPHHRHRHRHHVTGAPSPPVAAAASAAASRVGGGCGSGFVVDHSKPKTPAPPPPKRQATSTSSSATPATVVTQQPPQAFRCQHEQQQPRSLPPQFYGRGSGQHQRVPLSLTSPPLFVAGGGGEGLRRESTDVKSGLRPECRHEKQEEKKPPLLLRPHCRDQGRIATEKEKENAALAAKNNKKRSVTKFGDIHE